MKKCISFLLACKRVAWSASNSEFWRRRRHEKFATSTSHLFVTTFIIMHSEKRRENFRWRAREHDFYKLFFLLHKRMQFACCSFTLPSLLWPTVESLRILREHQHLWICFILNSPSLCKFAMESQQKIVADRLNNPAFAFTSWTDRVVVWLLKPPPTAKLLLH